MGSVIRLPTWDSSNAAGIVAKRVASVAAHRGISEAELRRIARERASRLQPPALRRPTLSELLGWPEPPSEGPSAA